MFCYRLTYTLKQYYIDPTTMSLRKLQYHEQKLLKKVDFLQWKSDDNIRVVAILRRYHIQRREDYIAYNKIVGHIQSLVNKLKQLPQDDIHRIKITDQLINKLFNIGLINSKTTLEECSKVNVSSICRRRLSVVLVRIKMCENIKQACQYIEQGHIRVGPYTVTEPAFIVTRSMEDHITWVQGSKIQRTIQKYNDALDDFTLLGN